MPQPLRVVDNQRVHARDAARAAVKRFRLDRDRERLPICNQSTGAKNLFIDEVLKRTEREMEPDQKKPMRIRGYLALALAMGAAAFTVLFIIAEALK